MCLFLNNLPDNAESKVPHLEGAPCKESTTPLNLTEHRKVVFDPCVEDKRPVQRKEKDFPKRTIHEARGHFTPNPGKEQMLLLNKNCVKH